VPRIAFYLDGEPIHAENCADGCTVDVGRSSAEGVEVRHFPDRTEVRIGHPSISAHHASVTVRDARVFIRDHGSRNGTLVPVSAAEVEVSSKAMLGPNLSIVVHDVASDWPIWSRGATDAELVAYLTARLAPMGYRVDRVDAGSPDASIAYAIAGSSRRLLFRSTGTSDVLLEAWCRQVISLFNAARSEPEKSPSQELPAASSARLDAERLARTVARYRCLVMIRGPEGVGKTHLAELIHQWSPRAAGLLGVIHCSSLRGGAADKELLGWEQGVHGAGDLGRAGLFEAMSGGTLVLDEVADLSAEVQPLLLRILQDRRVRRIGGSVERSVDVRVIATSRQPLRELIEAGTFRADLGDLLRGVVVQLPALSTKDAEAFARRFLVDLANEHAQSVSSQEADELVALAAKSTWRGGLRELRATIERYLIASPRSTSLEEIRGGWRGSISDAPVVAPSGSKAKVAAKLALPLSGVSELLDALMLLGAAKSNDFTKIGDVARWAGISTETVRKKFIRIQFKGTDLRDPKRVDAAIESTGVLLRQAGLEPSWLQKFLART
jgi:DNA-binding NtrC family response regulator